MVSTLAVIHKWCSLKSKNNLVVVPRLRVSDRVYASLRVSDRVYASLRASDRVYASLRVSDRVALPALSPAVQVTGQGGQFINQKRSAVIHACHILDVK